MTLRRPVSGLSLSALALIAWVTYESWAPIAKPPIPGDVPTHGFGTTTHEDGTPVALGEEIKPVQAVRRVVRPAKVTACRSNNASVTSSCISTSLMHSCYSRKTSARVPFAGRASQAN